MAVNTFNVRETGSCLIDANSALRNGTSTVGSFRALPLAANTFVAASSVAAGVLGVPIGLAIARDSCSKIKQSVQVGNGEGVLHHGLWCGVGAGYAGLSGVLGINGVYTLLGKTSPAYITPAFAYGGVGMYGALLCYGAHGLWHTETFNSELRKRSSQEALNWLNEQIHLNPTEISQCTTDDEKNRLRQKKLDRFALRTDNSCLTLVEKKLPALLDQFDPERADELIQEVVKACFKQRVKYIFLLVLALIGLAASLCVVITSGPASPLLFAISALGWFTVDSSKIHTYLGEKFWNWQEKKALQKEAAQPLLTDAKTG